MPASQDAQKGAQAALDKVTGNKESGIPGMVFVAVDKNGDQITANASGTRSVNSKEPMTLDTVFWIASCTKLLASIACMQLVEQGKLSLDDHKLVYKIAPELEKVQVLQDDGKLVPKEKEITLRMLLTHTAGFGYEFFNAKLRDYGRPIGFDCFAADVGDILRMPLVNQPGSKWEYGINIDWAGILLERVSGQTLNDYLQQHVFAPLDLHNINMFPTPHMLQNLASMNQRWPGSNITEERDHLYRVALNAATGQIPKDRVFNSGGAGAFAKPAEYVQVLATLLNNGTSPKTHAQILKPETVDAMFENSAPDFPNFGYDGLPTAKLDMTNPLPNLFPQEGNPPQGWGLSFHITYDPLPTGRSGGAGYWAGIANLFYWVDREKGVAGMIATQMMPFGDMNVLGAWMEAEKAVYDSQK